MDARACAGKRKARAFAENDRALAEPENRTGPLALRKIRGPVRYAVSARAFLNGISVRACAFGCAMSTHRRTPHTGQPNTNPDTTKHQSPNGHQPRSRRTTGLWTQYMHMHMYNMCMYSNISDHRHRIRMQRSPDPQIYPKLRLPRLFVRLRIMLVSHPIALCLAPSASGLIFDPHLI